MEEETPKPIQPEIVDDTAIRHAHFDGPPMGNPQSMGNPQWASMVATDGQAIIALVLAIASWLAIPFVGAIGALIAAHGSKRNIKRSGDTLGGKSLATAAQVIAILNILVCVILVWIVVAVLRWAF